MVPGVGGRRWYQGWGVGGGTRGGGVGGGTRGVVQLRDVEL